MTHTLAVDFDGVIHSYERGWLDGTIYGEPLPGALEALTELRKTYAVFVHTTRWPKQVAEWLAGHGVPTCVETGLHFEFWNDQTQVLVTNRKLPAVAYLDDRAVLFVSWPQALAVLRGEAAEASAASVLPTADRLARAMIRASHMQIADEVEGEIGPLHGPQSCHGPEPCGGCAWCVYRQRTYYDQSEEAQRGWHNLAEAVLRELTKTEASQ